MLKKIYLDGKDITSKAQIYPFHKNVALVIGNLSESLRYGSYHVIKVTSNEQSAAVMIRAWDNRFSLQTFGGGYSVRYLDDYLLHNINSFITFAHIGPSILPILNMMQEKGIRVRAMCNEDAEIVKQFKGHPNLDYFLADEPDGADWSAPIKNPMQRCGSSAMKMIEKMEFFRKYNRRALGLLNIDGTFKPANYYIYGQIPDIMSTDPYYPCYLLETLQKEGPQRASLFSPHMIYAVANVAFSACKPKPLEVVLCAFEYQALKFHRYPTPEEERVMVYYALGAGAKGITYYTYITGKSYPGLSANPFLWREVAHINAEIKTVSSLLSIGYPVDLIINSSPNKLWSRTLICGKDSIVIILVNEDYHSNHKGFTYIPIKNATIEVNVPEWIDPIKGFSVDREGVEEIAYKKNKNKVIIDINKLVLSKIIVLTQNKKIFSEAKSLWIHKLRPKLETLDKETPSCLQNPGFEIWARTPGYGPIMPVKWLFTTRPNYKSGFRIKPSKDCVEGEKALYLCRDETQYKVRIDSDFRLVSYPFKVTPNNKYLLSFKCKSEKLSYATRLKVSVIWYDKKGYLLKRLEVVSIPAQQKYKWNPSEYVSIKKEIISPPEAKYASLVFFSELDKGEIWLDDVVFKEEVK